MEYNQASRPNVVTLFFGIAVALMLVTVLVANLFMNRIPQPLPTDPALVSQSEQPGYSYVQAATTETVHNRADVLLFAIISMAAAVVTGIMIVSTRANRRIMKDINQFEQPKGFNATDWHQYQELPPNSQPQTLQHSRSSAPSAFHNYN